MNREQREEVATVIYDAMIWAAHCGPAPEGADCKWQVGGNSHGQEMARSAADSILAALSAPKAEAVIAECDHYKNGLQILANTFYKGDQHQDYAKHVLDTVPLYTSPVPALTDEAVERMSMSLERERSAVAEAITHIERAIGRREHLRHPGRGCYAWDDERYQQEFGHALDEVEASLEPLRTIARDWTDCPTDPDKIKAARAITDEAVERAAKAIHDGPLGASDEEDFGDNKASDWCREVARAALLAAFPSKGEGE